LTIDLARPAAPVSRRSNPQVPRLDSRGLAAAVRELAAADADLSGVLRRWGTPPLWSRSPGFATLIHLILEQQVSLASARAAMDRLEARVGAPTPAALLTLDDDAMLEIGFSRQKRAYARGLATWILDGRLDLDGLSEQPDEAVRATLVRVRGIGRWTADIYLLMALGRPDVWPRGDRALTVALRHAKRLDGDPAEREALELAERWRPWRSVAARLLWHLYLSEIRPPGGRAPR